MRVGTGGVESGSEYPQRISLGEVVGLSRFFLARSGTVVAMALSSINFV
ncbi:hypothetical protein AYL99_01753 [Fonsecaea erecta]|uniref:Uncharacterized protein n=1 Tax=Fonsecaea erecta TaxID=1367422 RepID=A0A179A2D8_9EURO|nr:hypothetical protein AYL99_01753 [Fonsecaea erecta]OAP65781.1 hypothetical protein AYL99_01753 [Fonsecaea erecta]